MSFPLTVRVRAVAVLGAVVAGVIGVVVARAAWLVEWPVLVVYLVLVWKAYAIDLVRAPADQTREHLVRWWTVAPLDATACVLLALSFSHPVRFAVLTSALLGVQAAVYASGVSLAGNHVWLRRVVKMHAVESVLALLVVPGIWLGYTQLALVFWGVLSTDIALYFIVFRSVGGDLFSAFTTV